MRQDLVNRRAARARRRRRVGERRRGRGSLPPGPRAGEPRVRPRARPPTLAKTVTVSDEELAKWVADHPDRYRTPPRVRARYAAYQPKDFAALAAPSEDAGQGVLRRAPRRPLHRAGGGPRPPHPDQAAARRRREGSAPRHATKAEDVLAKVKKGGDFAKLAQQVSEDAGSASKGGDLGLFSRGQHGAGVRRRRVRARAGRGERGRRDALRLPHHQGRGEAPRRPEAARRRARARS